MRRKVFAESVVPTLFVPPSIVASPAVVPQWSLVNKASDLNVYTTTTVNDTVGPNVGGGTYLGCLSTIAMTGTQKVFLRFHCISITFNVIMGSSDLSWTPYTSSLGSTAAGFGFNTTSTLSLYKNVGSANDGNNLCTTPGVNDFFVSMAYDQANGLVWYNRGFGWNDLVTPPQDPGTGQGGAQVIGGPWNYIAVASLFNGDTVQGLFTDTTGMPSGYSLPPAS